ncbi:uncharacterized protein EV420DRAFT_1486616 [Desarmillaria tabescens]|uniref:Uncharacterized protein n=1 Tax=Armillaria tabescens TaxID=1929756 RepID=A0AA39JC96_ARMTA|nr:uncharacterized protein EV420DRAFT_1486616 [Desarmillaria tabescens]KAK0438684.1 hypothetical protein EV420DRAFT_1486616 [Desarmillaria tabescens]
MFHTFRSHTRGQSSDSRESSPTPRASSVDITDVQSIDLGDGLVFATPGPFTPPGIADLPSIGGRERRTMEEGEESDDGLTEFKRIQLQDLLDGVPMEEGDDPYSRSEYHTAEADTREYFRGDDLAEDSGELGLGASTATTTGPAAADPYDGRIAPGGRREWQGIPVAWYPTTSWVFAQEETPVARVSTEAAEPKDTPILWTVALPAEMEQCIWDTIESYNPDAHPNTETDTPGGSTSADEFPGFPAFTPSVAPRAFAAPIPFNQRPWTNEYHVLIESNFNIRAAQLTPEGVARMDRARMDSTHTRNAERHAIRGLKDLPLKPDAMDDEARRRIRAAKLQFHEVLRRTQDNKDNSENTEDQGGPQEQVGSGMLKRLPNSAIANEVMRQVKVVLIRSVQMVPAVLVFLEWEALYKIMAEDMVQDPQWLITEAREDYIDARHVGNIYLMRNILEVDAWHRVAIVWNICNPEDLCPRCTAYR